MANPQTPGIYLIRNNANGKRYIGSTGNLRRRWYEHSSALRRNKHRNRYLQAAWNKYGEAHFEFVVVEAVDNTADLFQKEAEHIARLKPEFNLSEVMDNGRLGHKHSDETKAKIRAARTGTKHTPEAIAAMKAAKEGWKPTPEHSAAQAAALRGRPRSDEARAAISAGKTGKPLSDSHKQSVSDGVRKFYSDAANRSRT